MFPILTDHHHWYCYHCCYCYYYYTRPLPLRATNAIRVAESVICIMQTMLNAKMAAQFWNTGEQLNTLCLHSTDSNRMNDCWSSGRFFEPYVLTAHLFWETALATFNIYIRLHKGVHAHLSIRILARYSVSYICCFPFCTRLFSFEPYLSKDFFRIVGVVLTQLRLYSKQKYCLRPSSYLKMDDSEGDKSINWMVRKNKTFSKQ